MEFLEVYPSTYSCLKHGLWVPCTRDEICDNNLPQKDWKIDYKKYPETYHNWVDPDKLNLTCTSKDEIGLMGSAFFVGYALSSATVPIWSDKRGRKVPYLGSMWFQLVAYALIIVSKNIYLTIGAYVIVGLCAGGRVVVGMNYMNEFIPKKK